MRYFFRTLFIFVFFFFHSNLLAKPVINIGVVSDGEVKREILPIQQIKQETIELNSNEFDIRFPQTKFVSGNWKVADIKRALLQLLNDPDVDIIIANGLLASHEASKIKQLKKPVIAPVVADRILQKLPYENGHSGKSNYVYISDNHTVEQDLKQFHEMIPFHHLGIIVDSLFVEALPELKGTTYNVQEELGIDISFQPILIDPIGAVDSLPEEVDAIYMPPLFRFDNQEMKMLANRLIEKDLPSFSLLGRQDLEFGFLATLSGREVDTIRYSRRIALYIQSILLGTNAANLSVKLEQPSKLAINMRTAKAIGYSPKWRFLEIADLLYEESTKASISLSLFEAIQQAINANLSFQVEQINVALAKNDTDNARSSLLPQLNFGATATQINGEQAGFAQAERSSDVDITASQLIYSESAYAGYDVAKKLQQAETVALKSSMLDVIQSSSIAYLQLLQAAASEQVQRSNLSVTETNLELAQSRLNIGYTDRAEVLRWQSQLATARSDLYAAQSQRMQAETELKRVINLPLSDELSVSDAGIAAQLSILETERFQRFFDNPFSFQLFTEFEVERALNNSPEIAELEYVIASNKRQLAAAKRAYYVPDVSLNAQYGRNIERGGTGRNNSLLTDDQWSVGLQATLPLFAGGARDAEVSRSNNTLVQNQYRLHNIKQQIEANIRAALQQTNGSYPAIRLSKNASEAAKQNLSLVIDSYSKGIVSITDLINAQDAALSADLAAVEAQYAFMIDWVNIQRAVANFDLLLTKDGFNIWYEQLDQYFEEHN